MDQVEENGVEKTTVASTAIQWATRFLETSRSVSGFVTRMALSFLVAAVIVWTVPALPVAADVGAVGWAWRFILIVVLLIPAVVSFLFAQGLGQLAALPPQILEKAVEGKSQATALVLGKSSSESGRLGKFVGLLGGLWRVGRASLDAKDTVLGGVAIVRLFNPVVLVVVAVSVLCGVVLSIAAAARAIWWVVT